MSKRLLIAASGTGGHVLPAVAVAECLQDWHIEWLGVPDRLETQLLQGQFPLHTIPMSGLQGPKLPAGSRLVRQLWSGIPAVKQILKKGSFQAVFTTGGYIAAPAILGARWAGIPVILHESNAIPGKVTRLLGRWCHTVALGDAAAQAYLPRCQTVVVGTPVRAMFWQADLLSPDLEALGIPADVPLIGVIGGSQGGRGLNSLVVECAPAWLAAGAWILHITGPGEFERVSQMAPAHPHYLRFPFWQDVAPLLRRASFMISRSGSGTLTELAACGTPAILIPFPYAAEDHQFYNGHLYAAQGAAIMIRESDKAAAQLERLGLEWLGDPQVLDQYRQQMQQLAQPDAADRVAELLDQAITAQAQVPSLSIF